MQAKRTSPCWLKYRRICELLKTALGPYTLGLQESAKQLNMTIYSQLLIKNLSEDSIILKLLREIEMVIHFPIIPNDKTMVIHYLRDYRMRRPIGKISIEATPFSIIICASGEDPKILKFPKESLFHFG